MSLNKLQFPVVYYANRAYFLERCNRYSPTYFGGPSDTTFTGVRSGDPQLHHLLTITGHVVVEMQDYHLYAVPLFYGFRYGGGDLTYRVTKRSSCKVIKLPEGKPSPDFPYPNYPALLPYIPLSVARWEYCEPEEFAELTHQGLEIKPKTMVVVVPPIFSFGVSMWGPGGDAEGVQIIFECDFESKTIKALNQCT